MLHGFYTNYPPGHPISNPVTNEEVVDALKELRQESAKVMRLKFPQATVSEASSKALKISKGSLTRDVDVVLCNWWNTPAYINNPVLANRGICVLDTSSPHRIFNRPFFHNWQINDKDTRVGGGLRKAIRLLKNLKYDKSPEAKMSSYDIAALPFNMDDDDLNVAPGSYLKLAQNVSRHLNSLIQNQTLRESLWVPNRTRKVFETGGATLESLKEITGELDALLADITAKQASLIALSESMGHSVQTGVWLESRARRVQEVTNKLLNAA